MIDLRGPIIKKLGDNYVNVNSRDKIDRETAFRVGQHKKKKVDKKVWQKDRQWEIVRNIKKEKFI